MPGESLNTAVNREFIQRLLATGRAFDLERGGLYDARSGMVNVWAKRRWWSLENCFTFAGWVSRIRPIIAAWGSATNRDRHRWRVQPAASGEQAPLYLGSIMDGYVGAGCPSENSIPHSPSGRCSAHDAQTP
jgi:hypothetical protein